jgi:hypothetical protein
MRVQLRREAHSTLSRQPGHTLRCVTMPQMRWCLSDSFSSGCTRPSQVGWTVVWEGRVGGVRV